MTHDKRPAELRSKAAKATPDTTADVEDEEAALDRLFATDKSAWVKARAVSGDLPEGFGRRSFKRLLAECTQRLKPGRS